MDNFEYCPYCGAFLQGEEIPVELREQYGTTHFSRKIGIYDIRRDRIVQWMCPDCKGVWDRE